MGDDFFGKVQELRQQNQPFALAIVVRAEKPTSGKPGDKAVVTADGKLYGWIGGSCSQPTVIREALKALKEGKSRLIRLSPDPTQLTPRDGLIDLPLTCFSGGTLEIYIEPEFPPPRLLVVGNLPIARALIALGQVMNYEVVEVDPDRAMTEQGVPLATALADIGQQVRADTYVVIATHGSYDEAALEQVLKTQPRYIGLVTSRKRFASVRDYLQAQGISEDDLKRIKAPAGLDIQAERGDEIAVSILAEIIQIRRNLPYQTDWAAPVATASTVELPAAASGTAIDLVCGMEVEIASAKYTYDYEDTTYYFCAPGCKLAFRRNPEAYLHPTTALDPVCGMEVEIASAPYSSEYSGRTYYFCSEDCQTTFDQQPSTYAAVMHHH